jgi:cation:H+ antiporter
VLTLFALAGLFHGPTGISSLWPFAAILFSAVVIAWGAESAQFLISQGMALAILAWLQTLPEFAVEAVIAWEAGQDPSKIHLVTANFTGSLRLLVGLGWPMVYFTAAFFHKRRNHGLPLGRIHLEGEHAVEVMALLPPILYFLVIYFRSRLTWVDSVLLLSFYLIYLYVINRIPPQDHEKIEDLERIPRAILRRPPWIRNGIIVLLFLIGGGLLYLSAHPFLHSMLRISMALGISEFIFVQWVSPFLSEFPEKVSAFYWARKVSAAPMALMNLVSSNINQWTMLVAMIPLVFSASKGEMSGVPFDSHQKVEILLTLAQSFLGFLLLSNMRFSWYEAIGLFLLWFIQFVRPHLREEIIWVYFGWIGVECALVLLKRKRLRSFSGMRTLIQTHILKKKGGRGHDPSSR